MSIFNITTTVILLLLFPQINHALSPLEIRKIPIAYARSQSCHRGVISTGIATTRNINNFQQTTTSLRYAPKIASSLFPISLPIIQQNDSWGNIATICATASVSHGIGKTTALGRLLGPPVTAMALAFFLGSVGFLPAGMCVVIGN